MKYALIALIGLSTFAFAAEPAVEEKIKTLITQLGDDDPKARDTASKELRKVGKDAKAALAEAKKSDDAEVAARAEAIEKLIEQDGKPKTTVTPVVPRGRPMIRGGVSVQVSTTNGPGGKTRSVTVNEPGRVVHITEDKDGIAMQVTEGEETKEYKAMDADTLKKEHPEVAAVYDKYAKAGAVQVQIGQIQIGGLEGVEPLELPEADRERLKVMLELAKKRQERVQKLMEEMQKQMLEDLKEEK